MNRAAPMNRGCGKRRYRDEIAAKLALAGAIRKDGSGREKTERRAYKCPQCKGWHLTSAPRRGRGNLSLASRKPIGRTAPKHARRRDTGPSRRTRDLVLRRDVYACVCCGQSVEGQVYSLQHRKRRSQGGSNCASNLVTVLGSGSAGCHWRIDSRIDPEDEARGYTVRSHDDPHLVPVMIFSAGGSGVTLYPTCEGLWSTAPDEQAAA